MKNSVLILFFLGFAFTSFGQQATYIDTQKSMGFSVLTYHQDNKRLSNNELSSLMAVNSSTNAHLEKALKRKNLGLPIYVIGLSGIVASAFVKDISNRNAIGLTSLGAGLVGAFLLESFVQNRQKAVNLYNKNLIEDDRTGMQLDFKVDPLASGLVLRF